MAIVSPIKSITSNNKIIAIGEFTANDKISINTLEYNYININGNRVGLGESISDIATSLPSSTTTLGIVQLNDTIDSNSVSMAATANTVKTLNDKISNLSLTGGTVVGNNIINLTNPNANTFIKINSDNSVSALPPINFRNAIGAGNSIAVKRANGNTSLVLLNNDTRLATGTAIALNDTITSNSTTEAATANTVKTLNDLTSTKLDTGGGIIYGDLDISGFLGIQNSKFEYFTKIIDSGNTFILDEVSDANTINYLIQMNQGNEFHSTQLLILNGTLKEYCNVSTVFIGNLESSVIDNKITLKLTNYSDADIANIIVKFLRTSI